MINSIKISALVSVTLFVLMIIVSMNTTLQYHSMLLGMGLGISTSPIMMHITKKWKTKRNVDRILRELRELMNTRKEQDTINTKTDPENYA